MTRIPAEMRAAYVTEHGPPDGIRIGVLPVPRPGPDEVLIRVEALAANRVDTYVRSGAVPARIDFPFVIGRDLVGEVVGGTGYAVGQRVWCNSLGHDGRQGAHAEYVVAAADRVYPLPDGVDPLAAVAVLHPAATAHLALFRHARLRAGETVYVGGGSGNVGSAAIEFAVAAGARVVTGVRFSPRNDGAQPNAGAPTDLERCLRLGAEAVLDVRAKDLDARIAEAAGGGIDVHLETSGRPDFETAVRTLGTGGRIVVVAGLLARPAFPVGPFYTRDGSMIGFAMSNASVLDLAEAAAGVNAALAGGGLVPRIGEVLPFSAAAEAHRLIEAGTLLGRIVLTV